MAMETRDFSSAFASAARGILGEGMRKIEHCLDQLSDDQIWWRPGPHMNSIANLTLHLAGNLRQWIVAGIGGAKDVRNRPAEFSDRSKRPKVELLATLRNVVRDADKIFGGVGSDQLLSARRIQGFDTTVLDAIFSTIAHFRGHVQEIIHMTRAQLGAEYHFDFVPQGLEQEAAGGTGV